MKCVITYDIVEDKRRALVSKLLLGFGYRVQKSVFEGFCSTDYLEDLKKELVEAIDTGVDSIRIYRVCNDCNGKIEILGRSLIVEDVKYLII